MTESWNVSALSLATTLGVTYVFCAIFDLLFPPFGLLAAIAPTSPWPISGSPPGFVAGFALLPSLVLCSAHCMESHGDNGAKHCVEMRLRIKSGHTE
jgi:hypothetical protein